MSIEITIDGLDDVYALINRASNAVQNTADGLMQAVDATALPDVIEASQTIWDVESGEYSNSWNLEPVSSDAVSLFNTAPYAGALETGWTLKNGTQIASPGVLIPVVEQDINAIAQELESWIATQLE